MKKYFYDSAKSIYVSDDTLIITPYTFLSNGELWEKESIIDFYNLIDDKSYNIVDIGAQSGLYTLYAKYKPNSNFFAFEPFQNTYDLLNKNLLINQIGNVKTFNFALSDMEGVSILNTCANHNGLHTMGKPLRFNNSIPIQIKTSTLDIEFYDKDIQVDFIKIDTEGYEYFILKGGIKTIKKYKPTIQLEWNDNNMKQCNVSEVMLNELINELGYKKISLRGEELIILSINN